MSPSDLEQVVRLAIERATTTTLPEPEDQLAHLGNQHLWASESLVRLAQRYGPITPEVLRLVHELMARDPKMHFVLQVSGFEWQPDLVLALAEAAIKERRSILGPLSSPLDLLLE